MSLFYKISPTVGVMVARDLDYFQVQIKNVVLLSFLKKKMILILFLKNFSVPQIWTLFFGP